MVSVFDPEAPLPQFRSDLQLFRGPDDPDGSPTYNLLDPTRVRYFKISWAESHILQHLKPGMKVNELSDAIQQHSTLKIAPDEIMPFIEEAHRFGLLSLPRTSESLDMEVDYNKQNPLTWLLYNYLYIRIPLVNPDAFLTKTLHLVKPLGSPPALIAFGLICLFGLFLLIGRFDEFLNTFTYFFSLEGAITYALGISAVKIVHEMSHAYTAKNYGLHVPTMGVAFIVMWPVLYTDVTDGWKLRKRSERLAVSAAGVIAELIIAGLSTIGWVISPPGVFQSLFFVTASLTWISTLAINVNPAMRFDGYYMLCDLWGIDNLQPRAFSVTRWKLREWFLGLKVPPPEDDLTDQRIRGMIIYTIYTWIYRITLYIVIALFVYHTFTKALGVFLFFVEVVVFMLWPLLWEYQELRDLRDKMTLNPRSVATITVICMALAWFIVPLPHSVRFAAVTVPIDQQIVRAPFEAVLKTMNVKLGDKVTKGQELAVLDSKTVDKSLRSIEIQKELLEHQILVAGIREVDRPFIAEKQAELASAEEQYKAWKAKAAQMTLRSQTDGYVFEWDRDLRLDQPLYANEIIGKIAAQRTGDVMFYAPEADIDAVYEGQPMKFFTNSEHRMFRGKIIKVNQINAEFLPYPVLGSEHQGELPVTPLTSGQQQKLALIESFFTIHARLDDVDEPIQYGQSGYVLVDGPWKSKLMQLVRFLTSIFWKESAV